MAGDSLATRLSELARSLDGEDGVDETLQGIVRAAVETVPGAEYSGISVIQHRRTVRTVAATHDLVYRVDRVEYEVGEGPCLDSLYRGDPVVRLPNLATETRWPRFTARAVALGVRSMLSFQLYVSRGDLGRLTLYAREADVLTEESEQIGLLFAAHAAVAMAGAQRLAQLSQALGVRDLIGQAKGILMERHKLTGDQAFTVLVRASQRTNVKLSEIADHLVSSGELMDGG
ncbi:MAG TPA: GAF and ANTAR domain-containing protein [Micromonosporaceae bacterium]